MPDDPIRTLRPIEIDLGSHYRDSRLRITGLLEGAPVAAWTAPVPACPGWDVKAVVSHLVGVIEDGLAGRLNGPPDEELSTAEVARHAADTPAELLATWDRLAPRFERVLTTMGIWSAMIDGVSHEHDIRGALGDPGDRTGEVIALAARRLVDGLDVPATIEFDVGDEVLRSPANAGPTFRVTTTRFEVFRLRLGRRSRDQVTALPWVPQPPGSLVDALFVFGPRETALVE